jgi:3-oxoacyl-[acyl-carrier protein] reductase
MIAVTPRTSVVAREIAHAFSALDLKVKLLEGSNQDLSDVQNEFDTIGEGISSVVHICGPSAGATERAILSTDGPEWDTSCESVMRGCLLTLQSAYRSFRGRTGSIVVVTPTLGISGAGGIVPFATAVEGVRAMCKSAARQWGKHAVTVNVVAIPLAMFSPNLGVLTSHQSPPALDHLPEMMWDVVPAIQLFLGPGARGITGATIVVDGGSVMAP